jgi:hypothetical protein
VKSLTHKEKKGVPFFDTPFFSDHLNAVPITITSDAPSAMSGLAILME